MTKYTPGPWYIEGLVRKPPIEDEPYTEYFVVTKTANMVRKTGGEGLTICWTDNPHIPDEQREANARLIAAAPELLKALRKLLEVTSLLYSHFV